jgi:hypothetical protein
MMMVSLNSKADTKFHYGERVKFHKDFYGICKGEIRSVSQSSQCGQNTNQYVVLTDDCGGHTIYEDFTVCESDLVKL